MSKMEENNLSDTVVSSKNHVYYIRQLIGKGRFSRVYYAKDLTTVDTVVIKALINQNLNSPFNHYLYIKELRLLNNLKKSPLRDRYVNLKDTFQLDTGEICFVMEKLGTTLKALLYNVGRLSITMCRPIVRQIAQGLAGLKCMGIIHADLKPDNIMFCAGMGNNHLVKIIDFGWAFYRKDAHTMLYKKIQAIPYRAPEVCFLNNFDYGLDLWALGCIMPELVTGFKLFDVVNEDILVKLIIETLTVPNVIRTNLENLIERNKDNPSFACLQYQDLNTNVEDTSYFLQHEEDMTWFVDLIYKLLTILPEARITAVDVLAHPFMTMIHFIKYPSTRLTKQSAEIMKKCKLDI